MLPAAASAAADGTRPAVSPAPADPSAADTLTPEDRALSTLIEDTLRGGIGWLRFPRMLEARFQRETADYRLKTLVIAGTLVAFVLNLFLISDYAMIPDMFDQALMARLWIFTPVCLIGLWLMVKIHHVLLRETMAIGADLLAGAIQMWLCISSHSPHAQAYTTGMAMIILYSNIYVRTRFWLAAPTCVALLLMYAGSLWLFPEPKLELMAPIGLVLLSTAVFTLFYLYTLEHEERLNYLLAVRQKLLQQELSSANRQLERVSRVDALTQVANRRHFDTFLSQLWERAKRDDAEVGIVMLDVDCFKPYNDHYGHPAGDACLVQVAQALRHSLRRPGDLVARYGGEEFIAVLYKAGPAQAEAAAERVRSAVYALALPHAASFVDQVVTVSVGVATMRPSDRHASPQRLISLADEALYRAKNRGRNRVCLHTATVLQPGGSSSSAAGAPPC